MSQFKISALRWLETILLERFGYAFTLTQESNVLVLTLQGSEGSISFDRLQAAFHQSRSDFPCHQWQASADGYTAPINDMLPAPSETELPSPLIGINENGSVIHYDILGLTYWMLTRLEEVGRTDLDDHLRFPAISSHAFKHDYLERPIVDEWLHILGQVLQRQWPELHLKQHRFSMKVSHDVDIPSRYGFSNVKGLIRRVAGDLLKRRDFKSAALAPLIRANSRYSLHSADPANTFEWIMDQSELHGLTSAFYFICGRTDPKKDADYEPEHPAIRELIRRIHQRGHEIGLHPSYDTYRDTQSIVSEATRLRKIMTEENIQQQDLGGRMHYLRWEHPTTMLGWDQAGMTYDSTLSYADRPGFRCGTCYEYPAFDLTKGALKLRIRPLIAMECAVMAERYLGLGVGEAAFEKLELLKQRCRDVQGCFTLLWHNTQLCNKVERNLYTRVLSGG